MFSIIRKSFQFLNHQTFTPLYKSLVRRHLDYASSVWNPYKQKHIEATENVQTRATKQLPNMSDLSSKSRNTEKLALEAINTNYTLNLLIQI